MSDFEDSERLREVQGARSFEPVRVVIMGRPNVGKSTLFNRLVGSRKALVHDEPGVTRDRNESPALWWVEGKPYVVHLTDTGGLGGEKWASEIEHQVNLALEQAEIAVMVFDAHDGLTSLDEELLRNFQKRGLSKKIPIIAAVNKVDAEKHEELIADFYSAGLDPVLTISAEHGRGMDDLQDAIAELVPRFAPEGTDSVETLESRGSRTDLAKGETVDYERRVPQIAIVGRPNVGKSTMLNALIGEQRMITSPIAGTTVDAVDSLAEIDGKPYVFIDTAGIRRKSKTEQGVEVLSVVQARKALERADLALLVLDGERGITDQDEKIGGLIEDVGCSVILIVNKWDIHAPAEEAAEQARRELKNVRKTARSQGKSVKSVKKGTKKAEEAFTREHAAEAIRKEMGYLKYAPIVFTSALEKEGLDGLGELIDDILHQRRLKIPTKEFTEWVKQEATANNPFNAKFYMSHQSGRHPPTFVCHVNDPEKIHFSLRRHLVNALRARWGFMGSPVRMLFVGGKKE